MGHTACAEPQCLYKAALYLTFTSLPFRRILNVHKKTMPYIPNQSIKQSIKSAFELLTFLLLGYQKKLD